MPPIPVTILTGFLGAGKTTILLNLLPQLPPTYRLALLKNEFGDVAIDSQLASSTSSSSPSGASSISGVVELLNGCICCNLVGQLGDALRQLRDEMTPRPDRIIIETSGSAFPATLAMEVNRLAEEEKKKQSEGESQGFVLDGVVSVIDVENWKGYEDTSYTAKLQAKYTDLIVFNKWEGVSERRFDECLDRVGDLDVQTPWVKSDRGRVDKDVLLGIDGALFAKQQLQVVQAHENGLGHGHGHGHGHDRAHDHQSEVEVLSVTLKVDSERDLDRTTTVDTTALETLLHSAPREEVYRIKGILRCSSKATPPTDSGDSNAPQKPLPAPNAETETQYYILNWAFGRWTFTPSSVVAENADPAVVARLTLILARYESAKWMKKLKAGGLVQVLDDTDQMRSAQLTVERLL